MTARPSIFISAVTRELKSARQLVANALTALGYQPVWQDIFGAEQGDLREMLRRRIAPCEGVIQLIGSRYGCEPPAPDAQFGRVSYTQYEALHARAAGKKVWRLLLDEKFPSDPHDPEPEELRALQQSYRTRVAAEQHLFHGVPDATALELKVHQLRDELARLRRRWAQWAALVVVLLAALVFFAVRQTKQGSALQKQNVELAAKVDTVLLQVLREIPQATAQQRQPGEKEDDEAVRARVYAALEKKYEIPAGTLARELPGFLDQLIAARDTSAIDRANALYVKKSWADAEQAALEAKDRALARAGSAIPDAIAALELAAWSAREQIQYSRALEHFRAAAALTSRERDALEWARVQHGIAYVLLNLGRAREVEPILRAAAAARERVLGAEHPETLASRNNLAWALGAQGKAAEAEQEFRAVLTIMERVLGAEHPDTLASRSNLTSALDAQGKYAEAEQKHRARIAIEERVLGAEHPDTLKSRNNLAATLGAQGKYAEAEQEFRAVLTIMERVLGAEHPDTLKSRNNLAAALDAQGKHAEAEQEYRAVLAIMERVLGAEHPDTLASRSNLTSALGDQGKYAEAEQEFRAVLAVQERVLGAEHPDVFLSCYNLALFLQAQDKLKAALEYARRARDGSKRVLGEEHPDTKDAQRLCERLEAAGVR